METDWIDWKQKLMQLLDVVGEQEGVWFEHDWERHGITPAEAEIIKQEHEKYSDEIIRNSMITIQKIAQRESNPIP